MMTISSSNPPKLQYLKLKKDFLDMFLDRKDWGGFGSREQPVAVSSLLDIFQKTGSLAEQIPHLTSNIVVVNMNLLLQQVLPLPPKLYEQLLSAAVWEERHLVWQQPPSVIFARIEQFLVKMKTACLLSYEYKVWSEVRDYNYIYTPFKHASDDLDANQHEVKVETLDHAKQSVTRTYLKRYRNKIYARIRCGARSEGTVYPTNEVLFKYPTGRR